MIDTWLTHLHHSLLLNPPLPLQTKPQQFLLSRKKQREMEMLKQKNGRILAIFFCLLISTAAAAEDSGEGGGWLEKAPFLLGKAEVVTRTEAGEITVFRDRSLIGNPDRMHIGIVIMKPNALLIPHYVDADLILYVLIGKGKIGWISKDDFAEREVKVGDVLRIPAGSTFYFVNTGKDVKLEIIASIKPVSTDVAVELFTPFYVGGGEYPPSVFVGFDVGTLASAFQATPEEVRLLTSSRSTGSIIFIPDTKKSPITNLKQNRRLSENDAEMIKIKANEEKKKEKCTITSILNSIIFRETTSFKKSDALPLSSDPVESPDLYNIYNHNPNYKNDHGYSIEVNEHDYAPLKKSDIGVFLVNLTAGSMLAPHVNPRATEYAVVLRGRGTVEVVYPNGTQAMKAEVKQGDAFWVPRFHPFCQIAAGDGSFEIVGFSTSARRNRPQFLAGRSSILRGLMGEELAAGFGVSEEVLRRLVMRQEEDVILPVWEEKRGRE